MGHKAKTVAEGALLTVGLVLLSYIGDNIGLLLSGNSKTFISGAVTAALGALVVYIKARYSTPPDVKQQIDDGTFPQRRDESTRVEREKE